MHQWFGDKATFATWADLWLAEGFARYAEALAGELVPATGLVPATELSVAKTSARSITTTPTRITSFANSNQVMEYKQCESSL
jgi:aminopeptidase N